MTVEAFEQAAVLLAAGYGRRFGSDKRRWRLAGSRTLVETTLALYQDAFETVFVVLRPEDEDWSRSLGNCNKVFAPDAKLGMGHSLAAGVAAASDLDALFIALGDMPWVEPSTLTNLRRAMRHANAIVRPMHQNAPGHPVGFGRAYFSELRELKGDVGALGVLRCHRNRVVDLAVDDPGVVQDIDSPPA